jgi:hypothetical protein
MRRTTVLVLLLQTMILGLCSVRAQSILDLPRDSSGSGLLTSPLTTAVPW